jgi:hypothetical protein
VSLIDLVVTVHDRLEQARVAHAFGGALALAYVAEPRGTVDIDVNVFSPFHEIDAALAALASAGLVPEQDRQDWLPIAGIRLRGPSEPFPVDVFPSLDPAYDAIRDRVVEHPFGPEAKRLPFLSAEDLTLFKLSFGRAKDWVDLTGIAAASPDLDVEYVERQLVTLRGPSMYPRVARLRSLLRPESRQP